MFGQRSRTRPPGLGWQQQSLGRTEHGFNLSIPQDPATGVLAVDHQMEARVILLPPRFSAQVRGKGGSSSDAFTAAAASVIAHLSREDVRNPPQLSRYLVQAFHAHVGVRPRHGRVVNL